MPLFNERSFTERVPEPEQYPPRARPLYQILLSLTPIPPDEFMLTSRRKIYNRCLSQKPDKVEHKLEIRLDKMSNKTARR